MLKTVPLKNKPLCILEHNGDIYIGDARGTIYLLQAPYDRPRAIETAASPVSALAFHHRLYYGTWDGVVCFGERSRGLGSDMVKAMTVWRGRVFVSVDLKLFVLDLDLNILEEHDTESKIYCICTHKDRLIFGMGHGLVSTYADEYSTATKSAHDASILAMADGLSGCTYGRLMRGGDIVFASDQWIRSIFDAGLFSCGKSVMVDMKAIYSHSDDVVGVLRIGNRVISIGLDFCYKIHEDGVGLAEDEERELLDMLNS